MKWSDSHPVIKAPPFGCTLLPHPAGKPVGLPSSCVHLCAHATLYDPGSISRTKPLAVPSCWLPNSVLRRLLLYNLTRLYRFTSGTTPIAACAIPYVRLHYVIRTSPLS